jgi:hypothetical protein
MVQRGQSLELRGIDMNRTNKGIIHFVGSVRFNPLILFGYSIESMN